MRVRAASIALVIVALACAPALAQRTAEARVDAPGANSILTGSVDIRGVGEAVSGVRRVVIFVNSWSVAVKEPEGFARAVHAAYAWDTTRSVSDRSPAPNGRQTITVQVTSLDGDSDKASVEVVTDNPPQAPAEVRAQADGSRVTLSWAANPEPDILGYVVERDEGRGYVEVATTTATKLVQKLVPGDYAFRVTAVRSSDVSENGISSVPSAPAELKIAASSSGGSGAVTRLGGRRALSRGRAGLGNTRSSLAALLSNSTLPDQRGLPPIPSPPGIPWGDFEEELPYGQPAVDPPGSEMLTSAGGRGDAALLPADGLRWVAAGLLLIACAGLAGVTAARDAMLARRIRPGGSET
jgi:hypothetical protein